MRLPFLFFGLLLVAGGMCVNRGQSSQEPLPLPAAAQTARSVKFALQGAGSCAAAACHNADAVTGFQGREYRISLERDFGGDVARVKDKHAQAFAVLFEERSQRMVRQWKGWPADQPVHPEREALCLRCHVHPNLERQAFRTADGVAQFRWEDGVSCEACHGPAERWLAAHFRPGWKELSAARRADFGMNDTRSVLGRVRMCVDCHVGSPDAEVNHDLIAAGHPWLKFEIADYHARWHKHWDVAKDKNPSLSARATTDFEARLWLVGQVASAKAALELLAERARDTKRPWPEFAEHDCFACHHDLKGNTSRPASSDKLGTAAWNTWYMTMLPGAVAATTDPAKLEAGLQDLRGLMAGWRPPRGAVAAKARQLAADLDDWLVRWERQQPERLPMDMLARHVLSVPAKIPPDTWIVTSQWHQALAAVSRARADQGLPPPPWLTGLPTLEKLLRLPGEFDRAAVRELARSMQTSEIK